MTPDRPQHPDLEWIEAAICDLAAEHLGLRRDQVRPQSRLIEDLHCDSLDLVELLMTVEEHFGVELPEDDPDPVYKAVFTRVPFRLSDLGELVCLRWNRGVPERTGWFRRSPGVPASEGVSFSQLSGRFAGIPAKGGGVHESLGRNDAGWRLYRRVTDGMRCVAVPSADVALGSRPGDGVALDECPRHRVSLSAFLMDAEPVSTTAFARFLNSIGEVDDETLRAWFVLDPADHRQGHAVLERAGDAWRPVPGAEAWPMILVSWYGAAAYSLWANGRNWRSYEADALLPTEAQWEYAARGAEPLAYPWGDRQPEPGEAVYGQHRRAATYAPTELPIAAVNTRQGMSPFGLHHMAGNVWHWCRDWYDADFYRVPDARAPDACNATPTGVRSERGGSWIGPPSLIRCSFRRGRAPHARGRCLGFRCAAPLPEGVHA